MDTKFNINSTTKIEIKRKSGEIEVMEVHNTVKEELYSAIVNGMLGTGVEDFAMNSLFLLSEMGSAPSGSKDGIIIRDTSGNWYALDMTSSGYGLTDNGTQLTAVGFFEKIGTYDFLAMGRAIEGDDDGTPEYANKDLTTNNIELESGENITVTWDITLQDS